MATTHVPPLRDLNPLILGVEELEKCLKDIHEILTEMQGDSDKADTIDAVCYYDGQVDALQWVLDMLTVPAEVVDEE